MPAPYATKYHGRRVELNRRNTVIRRAYRRPPEPLQIAADYTCSNAIDPHTSHAKKVSWRNGRILKLVRQFEGSPASLETKLPLVFSNMLFHGNRDNATLVESGKPNEPRYRLSNPFDTIVKNTRRGFR